MYTTYSTRRHINTSPELENTSHSSVAVHDATWKKSGGERQIPYDLTYKWNLVNKTNKWAKQNQRLGNKEQTDSDQRGRGRRIEGGPAKEHEERVHGHGQWGGLTVGVGESMGKKEGQL